MFLSRNKKNNVYPYKPQFYYIEAGFKGVKIYRHVSVMCDFICGVCFVIIFFLISPSFGALGGVWFVIVVFPRYLHLHFVCECVHFSPGYIF